MTLPIRSLCMLLAACVLPLSFSGCAPSSGGGGGATRAGLKEYTLEVKKFSWLKVSAPLQGLATFKATATNQGTDGDGNTQVELALRPAYGGYPEGPTGADEVSGATQRLTPKITGGEGNVVVYNRKLMGIPLSSVPGLKVEVPMSGPAKGMVTGITFIVSSKDLVECRKQPSGKYRATFRQNGQTYTVTLDSIPDKTANYELPQTWDMGLATSITIRAGGISVWHEEAGPDGADFSHLETQTKRESFD